MVDEKKSVKLLNVAKENYSLATNLKLDKSLLKQVQLDYFRLLLIKNKSFNKEKFEDWATKSGNIPFYKACLEDIEYLISQDIIKDSTDGILYLFEDDSKVDYLLEFQEKFILKNKQIVNIHSTASEDSFYKEINKKNQDFFKQISEEGLRKFLSVSSNFNQSTLSNLISIYVDSQERNHDISMLRKLNFWENQKIGDKNALVKPNEPFYLGLTAVTNSNGNSYYVKQKYYDISQTNLVSDEISFKKITDFNEISKRLEDTFFSSNLFSEKSFIDYPENGNYDEKLNFFASLLANEYLFDENEKNMLRYSFLSSLGYEANDIPLEKTKYLTINLNNVVSTMTIINKELSLDNIIVSNLLEEDFYITLGKKDSDILSTQDQKEKIATLVGDNRYNYQHGLDYSKIDLRGSYDISKDILDNEQIEIKTDYENLFLMTKTLEIKTGDFQGETFVLEVDLSDEEMKDIVARNFLKKIVESQLRKMNLGLIKNEHTRNKKLFTWEHSNDTRRLSNDSKAEIMEENGRRVDTSAIRGESGDGSLKSDELSDESGLSGTRGVGDSEQGNDLHLDIVNLNDIANEFIADRINPKKEEIKNFNAWISNNQNKTVTLYHGTSSKHNIVEDGLKLNQSKNFNISKENSISFALNEFSASNWGEIAYPQENITTYRIQVKISDLIPDVNQIRNNVNYYNIKIGNSLAESVLIGQGVAVNRNILANEIVGFNITKKITLSNEEVNKVHLSFKKLLKKLGEDYPVLSKTGMYNILDGKNEFIKINKTRVINDYIKAEQFSLFGIEYVGQNYKEFKKQIEKSPELQKYKDSYFLTTVEKKAILENAEKNNFEVEYSDSAYAKMFHINRKEAVGSVNSKLSLMINDNSDLEFNLARMDKFRGDYPLVEEKVQEAKNSLTEYKYSNYFEKAKFGTFEHTKTHEMLNIMVLADKLSKDEFKEFSKYISAEKLGYYSRTAKGFIITNDDFLKQYSNLEITESIDEEIVVPDVKNYNQVTKIAVVWSEIGYDDMEFSSMASLQEYFLGAKDLDTPKKTKLAFTLENSENDKYEISPEIITSNKEGDFNPSLDSISLYLTDMYVKSFEKEGLKFDFVNSPYVRKPSAKLLKNAEYIKNKTGIEYQINHHRSATFIINGIDFEMEEDGTATRMFVAEGRYEGRSVKERWLGSTNSRKATIESLLREKEEESVKLENKKSDVSENETDSRTLGSTLRDRKYDIENGLMNALGFQGLQSRDKKVEFLRDYVSTKYNEKGNYTTEISYFGIKDSLEGIDTLVEKIKDSALFKDYLIELNAKSTKKEIYSQNGQLLNETVRYNGNKSSTFIGKNISDGDVFVDEKGVRSYVEKGSSIETTERVGVVPNAEINTYSSEEKYKSGDFDFLTKDEIIEFINTPNINVELAQYNLNKLARLGYTKAKENYLLNIFVLKNLNEDEENTVLHRNLDVLEDVKEEISDFLDRKISGRANALARELGFMDNGIESNDEMIQEWLKHSSYEKNSSETNNDGATIFGIRDTFLPLDDYLERIKESDECKSYFENRLKTLNLNSLDDENGHTTLKYFAENVLNVEFKTSHNFMDDLWDKVKDFRKSHSPKEEAFDISNQEILDLFDKSSYGQITKDGLHYEFALYCNSLEYNSEPHIFWSEVSKQIDNKSFNGLTFKVWVDKDGDRVFEDAITHEDFNALMPDFLLEKVVLLESYEKSRRIFTEYLVANSEITDKVELGKLFDKFWDNKKPQSMEDFLAFANKNQVNSVNKSDLNNPEKKNSITHLTNAEIIMLKTKSNYNDSIEYNGMTYKIDELDDFGNSYYDDPNNFYGNIINKTSPFFRGLTLNINIKKDGVEIDNYRVKSEDFNELITKVVLNDLYGVKNYGLDFDDTFHAKNIFIEYALRNNKNLNEDAIKQKVNEFWDDEKNQTVLEFSKYLNEQNSLKENAIGKTYKYGLNSRPASGGAVPDGFMIEEGLSSDFRHGIISYDRELSKDEIKNFELVDINNEHFEEMVNHISKRLEKYADKYLDEKYLSYFESRVKDILTEKWNNRIAPSRYNEMIENVKQNLINLSSIGLADNLENSNRDFVNKNITFKDGGAIFNHYFLLQKGKDYKEIVALWDEAISVHNELPTKKQDEELLDSMNQYRKWNYQRSLGISADDLLPNGELRDNSKDNKIVFNDNSKFKFVIEDDKTVIVSNLKDFFTTPEIDEKFIKKQVQWEIFGGKYHFDLKNDEHIKLLANELGIIDRIIVDEGLANEQTEQLFNGDTSFADKIIEDRLSSSVSRLVEVFGIDRDVLQKMIDSGITESNINAYGYFDKLKASADKEKVREYFKNEVDGELGSFKTNVKFSNLLKDFIVNGELDIDVGQEQDIKESVLSFDLDDILEKNNLERYGNGNFVKHSIRNSITKDILKTFDSRDELLEYVKNGDFEKLLDSQTFSATLKFENVQEAEDFAKAYSRKTLRGHTITSDNKVVVDKLTSDDKKWVDTYVSNINKTKLEKSEKEEDFTIEDEIALGGAKTKFRNYINGFNVIKKIERGEEITKEDKISLSKMNGLGTISQAFIRSNGEFNKGWEKEGRELRELMSDKEYEQAQRAVLDSYYTDETIAKAMWKGITNFGFNKGSIVEPSVGLGNFFGYMPKELKPNTQLIGVELDGTTSKAVKALYPNAKIYNTGFEDFKLPSYSKASLVIGNPPYGSHKIIDSSNKELDGMAIHNYFMGKSIDCLEEGGVMAMVVSSSFLDSNDKTAREYVAQQADLVGAIRLPEGSFGNANTQVVTDIVFFRKREAGEEINDTSWVDIGSVNDTPINKYYEKHEDNLLGNWGKFGNMYKADAPSLKPFKGENLEKMLNEAVEFMPKYMNFQNGVMSYSAEKLPESENSFSKLIVKNKDNDLFSKMYKNEDGEFGSDKRINTYFIHENELFMRLPNVNDEIAIEKVSTKLNSKFEEIELKDEEINRIKGMVEIANAVNKLRDEQLSPKASDDYIESLRADLNLVYDEFVKKYKFLNNNINKNLFADDVNSYLLLALESKYDKGLSSATAKKYDRTPIKENAVKADIFFKRTQSPYINPTTAESYEDALHISLSEKAFVDMNYISELLNKNIEDVEQYLSSKDLIYDDPNLGWVTKEEYLSGNVKKKLKEAINIKNIEALEKVIPKDIDAIDISVSCGAGWIPPKIMGDFCNEILGKTGTKAVYTSLNAIWDISRINASVDKQQIYGTGRKDAREVLLASLNNKQITIYDELKDGLEVRKVVNQDETTAVSNKIELVKEAWDNWIWADLDRRDALSKLYNDTFNTHVGRDYNGNHLTFPNKISDSVVEFRPHQKNAIWRVLSDGVALLDHEVGSGKTFTAIGSIMELKRTGKADKPLLVVPNHLVNQWAKDFVKLYPNADILVPTEKDFSSKKRKVLMSRIATGNYDVVIVAHSQLGLIENDKEFEEKMLKDEIKAVNSAINSLRADKSDVGGRSASQLAQTMKSLENKIETLKLRKDDNLTFGQLGIDCIVVDEAHEFKNLQFHTTQSRIKGLGNPIGSKKAYDMFLKTQMVLEKTGGKNLIFLTGTPISNTIAEMYTMQKYLMLNTLKDLNLEHFDAWIKQNAEVTTEWELDASSRYKLSTRLSKFKNVPELMKLYNVMADVVDTKKVHEQLANEGKRLNIPTLEGGKPYIKVLERSEEQSNYIGVEDDDGNFEEGTLVWRSENLPKGKPQKGDDNALVVMSDARKASLDMRLIDDNYEDNPNSKVNLCVNDSIELYKKYDNLKGIQLIFCDLSTPKSAKRNEIAKIAQLISDAESNDIKKREKALLALDKYDSDELDALKADFSVYDDVKEKLISGGIPESEIAYIHDYNTQKQKTELFEKVNNGVVRFLLGSTTKMGAGMNVQQRAIALHHLDVPWRPSDLEQREGRVIRQGNLIFDLYRELKDCNYDKSIYSKSNNYKNIIESLGLKGDKLEKVLADSKSFNKEFEVVVNRYATKNSLDASLWERIERKARFIQQIKNGNLLEREVEDISGEVANASEMKACASGNPLIQEEMALRVDIKKLEAIKKNFNREVYQRENSINKMENETKTFEHEKSDLISDIEKVDSYLKIIEDNHTKYDEKRAYNKENKIKEKVLPAIDFIATKSDGSVCHDKKEFGSYVLIHANNMKEYEKSLEIGSFAGLDLSIERKGYSDTIFTLIASGKNDYGIDFSKKETISGEVSKKLISELKGIPSSLRYLEYKHEKNLIDLPKLKDLPTEFNKEAELQLKKQQHKAIINELQSEKDKKRAERANTNAETEQKKPITKTINNWIDSNKTTSTLDLLSSRKFNLDVLEDIDLEISHNCLVLNNQLEPKEFADFKKIYEEFGGKWDRRLEAIVFSDDGISRIKDLFGVKDNSNKLVTPCHDEVFKEASSEELSIYNNSAKTNGEVKEVKDFVS
jgi:N12 class adenine-specific DNA methylase